MKELTIKVTYEIKIRASWLKPINKIAEDIQRHIVDIQKEQTGFEVAEIDKGVTEFIKIKTVR